jgi:hypothetical protein
MAQGVCAGPDPPVLLGTLRGPSRDQAPNLKEENT